MQEKGLEMLNRWEGIGRLGKEVDMRYTQAGKAAANFSLACTEKWKANGEMKERTEWVRCVAFDKLGEICGQYLKKGGLVYVSGKMVTREYEDKDKIKRYSTEIVLGEMKMLSARNNEDSVGRDGRPAASSGAHEDEYDDDIPF